MREAKLENLLAGLRKKNPKRSISQIRLLWPDIKAAVERGHTLKAIHERLIKGGLRIDYKVLSVYVARLRQEDAKKRRQEVPKQRPPELLQAQRRLNATIAVPMD